MRRVWILGVALALFVAALPLISYGATEGEPAVWWFGFGLFAAATALAPVARVLSVAGEGESREAPASPPEQDKTGNKPEDRESGARSR